jgi:hypothetical protein
MTNLTTILLVVLAFLAFANAATEPRTGITFPDRYKGSSLDAMGVRYKGPIRVYAVGKYADTFLLKMAMGVSAEKIASSTADAVRPRCSDKAAVEKFQTMLVTGLPNGCAKGTSLAFGTGGGKLSIAINDKGIGSISSKPLAKAFAAVYTDKNAVLELKPISGGDNPETTTGKGLTPTRCAIIGAAVGWGIGKLFL